MENLLFLYDNTNYEVVNLDNNVIIYSGLCVDGVSEILGVNKESFVLQISESAKKGWTKLEYSNKEPADVEYQPVEVKEWYNSSFGERNFIRESYYRKIGGDSEVSIKISGKKTEHTDTIVEILEEIWDLGDDFTFYLKVKKLV